MNPLYSQYGPQNNMGGIMQRFQQFKQNFQGDPRQQVQQMLNSGKISQAQYDQAVRMANMLSGLLK